jgi:hypothetical protein
MVALAAAHWRRAAAMSSYAIFGVLFQPKKRPRNSEVGFMWARNGFS